MKDQNNPILLIHGAWEGAWSWNKTIKLLREKGHVVDAIDLPGHGDDKTPIAEIDLTLYVNHVKEELRKRAGKVVLVGHSFAGFVFARVAEEMPEKIEKMVFIASAIPYDGKSAMEVFEEDKKSEFLENLIISEDKSYATMSRETILNIVFTGATEDQLDEILPQLVPQALAPFMENIVTTKANFGSVPKAYVETTLDRVISLDHQRYVQQRNGITESVTLEYGHVPLETAPEALADALDTIFSSTNSIV
ncbi:MAG: alpha/beta hydrolase [Roseivirga sp.]|nr:alpha/beta hydrolase [Roseivirga sp.]